jgi:hypothetical protein
MNHQKKDALAQLQFSNAKKASGGGALQKRLASRRPV